MKTIPVASWTSLVACVLCGAAAEAQSRVPELVVDSIFSDIDLATVPGCAVGVTRDGSTVLQRGYGMANLEYGIPITPRSVFHVASVSKQFTAMAVELLVNEGRVSWDDDIRQYVPEVPDFGTPITLRHLVHHVSGIRDQWSLLAMAGWRWEADVVTQGDVLAITSRQTALNFTPGERYLYSNTGFTLLAVVVERVSGESLREFTRKRIFEPLGMDATHFHDDHEMIVRNRAMAYGPDPDGDFGLKNSIPDFDVVGATSLFTTVQDLAAWDRNFYTGRVGGAAALARMHETFVLNSGDTITYAHGQTLGTYRGLANVSHGGADAGYRSFFARFPDQHLGVALLCNFPTANTGDRAMRVAAAFLDDRMEPVAAAPPPAPRLPTVAVPRAQLERLAGVYRGDTPNQLIGIRLDGDSLRIGWNGGPALRPVGEGRFDVTGGPVVTMRADSGGMPGTLSVPGTGELQRLDAWTLGIAELALFAGVYESAELGTEYTVTIEEGRVVVHHRKLHDQILMPTYRDAFLSNGRVFTFTRNSAGIPDSFTLSDGRVWNVRFTRKTR